MTTTYGSDLCFFCAKPTPKKKITWEQQRDYVEDPEGVDATRIHLCPKCAVALGIQLLRDGLKETTGQLREDLKRQISVSVDFAVRL